MVRQGKYIASGLLGLIAAGCATTAAPGSEPVSTATLVAAPTTISTPTSSTLVFRAPQSPEPTAPTTTLPPPVAETKPFLLQPGDEGPLVQQVQERLKQGGYDPGPIDSQYGPAVQAAVRAFQRVNGLVGDGLVGPLTMAAFDNPAKVEAMRPEGPPDRVEVSISRKLLVAYQGGAPVVVTHISSGSQIPFCENGVCGDAVTPIGDYTAIMKVQGWEKGPLGDLYNSVYFWPAYAIHGSPDVPDVGASHGCIRIPMHISEYFPSLVSYGEPIYVMA